MATIVLVIAILAGAFVGRSAIIRYHRQARINALRDDLAAFFATIDAVQSRMPVLSHGAETNNLERQQKARADTLLIYRRILLRLDMSEPIHQRLEKALEAFVVRNKGASQDDVTAAVTLARTVLNEEWEATNYSVFTEPLATLKKRWKQVFGLLSVGAH
jgi:hypothetical protein